MAKKVTFAKIAEACNTSIGTVDRALNNRSGINEETRQLILDTALAMGYKTQKYSAAFERHTSKRIAVIYPSEPQDFYNCIAKGIEKAASEVKVRGVEIEEFRYDVSDPQKELDILENLDIDRYDAVAINPVSAAASEYIDRLTSAKIPTALFDNDLPGSSRDFYIGGNSFQSGQMGAEVMGLLMGGKGSVTVLGNFSHSIAYLERFDGFCQTMYQYYPDIDVFPCADCRHDPDLMAKSIKNFLLSTSGTRGIFCTGYSSTIGALRALKESDQKDVFLVGYDVSNSIAQAITEGRCKAVMYQNPFQQGYQVVHQLTKNLLDGWTPSQKQYYIETRIVFRQNIDNYVDGVMLWDLFT